MTKCPPKHCKPTTSFFYKVLISIKQLQSKEKYCNGVTLEEIEKFMEKKYCLTGDIRSQLENSLCIADQSRLLVKRKKYYTLVSPAANLHVIPEPCVKAKLEEIQRAFNSVKCPDKNVRRKSCRIQLSPKIYSSCEVDEKPVRKNNKRKCGPESGNTRSRSRSRSFSRRHKESRAKTPRRSRSRSPSRSMSPKRKPRSRSPKRNDKNENTKRSKKRTNGSCETNRLERSSSPFTMPSKSCLKKSNAKSSCGLKKEVFFTKEDKTGCPCDSDSSDN